MRSLGKGVTSATTQVKVLSPEISFCRIGSRISCSGSQYRYARHGERGTGVPGSKSVVGGRTVYIGTWENRGAPYRSPREAEKAGRGYGAVVVGLTRIRDKEFMPKVVIVKTAGTHDSTEAKELCADVKSGEIVVFDKAYIDYKHLHSMTERGISWVSRSKANMKYKTVGVGQHKKAKGKIIRDEVIVLTCKNARENYPEKLRLVEAWVEINGKEKRMTFITNNFTWAASSVTDLYRSRWGIEVFFKELKQTFQIADFIGYNENAVKWQIWTALLTYILLRFIAFQSKWGHSFFRLFTMLRGVLWSCLNMFSVLECYGTAGGTIRLRAAPEQSYLPGFAPI